MIVSFYDENFNLIEDNSSFVIDNNSYKLVRRSTKFDSLEFVCEKYTGDIDPTFLVIKNDLGRYVYSAFAGIPIISKNNTTEITAKDIKTVLNNDIYIDWNNYSITTFKNVIQALFTELNNLKILGSDTDINYSVVGDFTLSDLKPNTNKAEVINCWEYIHKYLLFYNYYIETNTDIVNKKINIIFNKAMQDDKLVNIKLWEQGLENYGRVMTAVNETQGIAKINNTVSFGDSWILLSNNNITTNPNLRNLFPVKKRIVFKEGTEGDLLADASTEALENLLENLYKENIEIEIKKLDFGSKCAIYIRRGQSKYKDLPVGELHYNTDGLFKAVIGYRFTGLKLIK